MPPFLQEHRHWGPRRLIWRLPPAIPESALAFYQKALETLGQGGYNRFVAGDWGAVALVGAAGGQVYGDQTLGVRNSWSVKAVREFKVSQSLPAPGTSVRSLAGYPRGCPLRQFLELPLPLRRPGRLPRRSRRPDPAGQPALDCRRRQGPPLPQSSPESPGSGTLVQTAGHLPPGGGPAPQPPAPGPTPRLAGPPPPGSPPPVNKLQA